MRTQKALLGVTCCTWNLAVVGSLPVATHLVCLNLLVASLRQAAGLVGALPPAAMQVLGAPAVFWQPVLRARLSLVEM